jgi:2-phospho-L-lactate guanylyltransferase (CobY/MobA/RfbA family)
MEDFYNGLGGPEQLDFKRKTVDVKLIIGILVILAATFLATISSLIRLGGIYSLKYGDLPSLGALLAPVIISIIFSVLIIIASKNNRGRNILIFSIIALVFSFGSFSYQIKESIAERQKEKVAIGKITNILKDLVSQKEIVKEDITTEKYGKSAPVLKIIQDTYIEMQEIMKENNNIVSVMNDSSTFSKKTLSDLSKIKEKRELLDKTSKNIEVLGNKINDLMDRFKSRFENLEVNSAMKAGIKEGLKNSFYKSTEVANNNLEFMDNVIKNMGNMIAFLEKNQGAYTFEGEQLVFYKDDDVSAYNKLFAEYYKAIDENNKNFESFQNNIKEKINDMEKIIK